MRHILPDSGPEGPKEKKHFISDGFDLVFFKQLPVLLDTRDSESIKEAKLKYQMVRASFSMYNKKEAQIFDQRLIQKLDELIKSGSEPVIIKKNADAFKAFIQANKPITIIDPEIIDKLFNKYGDQFAGETLELWQERFTFENGVINPKIHLNPKINEGNNRHLLLTIIRQIDQFLYNEMKLPNGFNQWVKDRFGFDYQSVKSRYNKEHPEATQISELLLAKKKLDDF